MLVSSGTVDGWVMGSVAGDFIVVIRSPACVLCVCTCVFCVCAHVCACEQVTQNVKEYIVNY